MPAKRLTASEVPQLLEIERRRFSDVNDDLLDLQKDQINSCLELWRTPDTSSRQWGRARARQLLEAIYNDKSLGKDVFLLCAVGIVVTRLGRINIVETVSELRKWWRTVDHPRGLAGTAEDCVRKHQDVFSKIKREPAQPTSLAVVPESNDQPTESRNASLGSSGNLTWPGDGQYFCFSFTGRDMIENLPDPFRIYMKNSNMWKREQQEGGLSVTNCLSLYLPEEPNEDTLLVMRMGYHDGFNLSASLGLFEGVGMTKSK